MSTSSPNSRNVLLRKDRKRGGTPTEVVLPTSKEKAKEGEEESKEEWQRSWKRRSSQGGAADSLEDPNQQVSAKEAIEKFYTTLKSKEPTNKTHVDKVESGGSYKSSIAGFFKKRTSKKSPATIAEIKNLQARGLQKQYSATEIALPPQGTPRTSKKEEPQLLSAMNSSLKSLGVSELTQEELTFLTMYTASGVPKTSEEASRKVRKMTILQKQGVEPKGLDLKQHLGKEIQMAAKGNKSGAVKPKSSKSTESSSESYKDQDVSSLKKKNKNLRDQVKKLQEEVKRLSGILEKKNAADDEAAKTAASTQQAQKDLEIKEKNFESQNDVLQREMKRMEEEKLKMEQQQKEIDELKAKLEVALKNTDLQEAQKHYKSEVDKILETLGQQWDEAMEEVETKHIREKENIKGQYLKELQTTKRKLAQEKEGRATAEKLLEQYKQAVYQLQQQVPKEKQTHILIPAPPPLPPSLYKDDDDSTTDDPNFLSVDIGQVKLRDKEAAFNLNPMDEDNEEDALIYAILCRRAELNADHESDEEAEEEEWE